MSNDFAYAALQAEKAMGDTTDDSLRALAAAVKAIAQGLEEQSKNQNRALHRRFH